MDRYAVWVVLAATLVAGCASSAHHAARSTATSTSTSTRPAGDTTATSAAGGSTSSTTPAPAVTTTSACPDSGGSTAAVHPAASTATALLTSVTVTNAPCADRVIFTFILKTVGTPSCGVSYENGPFDSDATGAPVTVRGAAFMVVRCSPASGHDFVSGRTTYTGPKRIDPSGAHHVRELVETGDFEGVVTWVVGLDTRQPFRVATTTIPPGVATFAVVIS